MLCDKAYGSKLKGVLLELLEEHINVDASFELPPCQLIELMHLSCKEVKRVAVTALASSNIEDFHLLFENHLPFLVKESLQGEQHYIEMVLSLLQRLSSM
jgi:hypothetical protein